MLAWFGMRNLLKAGNAVLIFGAASLYAGLPSHSPSLPEDLPVIDVHTHIFNCRDLPLRGILMARGVPLPAAYALEAALVSWTPDEQIILRDPSKVFSASGIDRDPSTGAWFGSRRRVLSADQRNKIADYLGEKSPRPSPEVKALLDTQADVEITDRELVAKALFKAGFPPPENPAGSDKTQALFSMEKLGGFMDFLEVMTQGHTPLVDTLRIKRYAKTDLFVHHMMDLEMAYASPPTVPFSEQLTAMENIDRQQNGALLHFVAFDPFRRENAVPMVLEGIQAGAVGVKFYPPSGYRPVANDIPGKPFPWPWNRDARLRWESRYHKMGDKKLDKYCEEFFLKMIERNLPVFVHCTPFGFESESGYGLNAHPKYWGKLLADPRFSGLRLCLGHAGGEEFWFEGKKSQNDSKGYRDFGAEVVRLCLAYPNVYCEVGYLERILDEEDRSLFKAKLAELLDKDGTGGAWKFGDKIMYGTDWHMIEKEPHQKDYLQRFDEILSDIDGGKWRRRFFAGNAVKFLGLADLARDSRFKPEQQARWREIVRVASLQEPVSPSVAALDSRPPYLNELLGDE